MHPVIRSLSASIAAHRHDVLSSDLFDTVLLRDHTVESERFAIACRRAAPRIGVDPRVLARLRWSFHDSAYRAVAMERPEGDAALGEVWAAIATVLGRGAESARLLHRTEVEVDSEHLRPNTALLDCFTRATAAGVRVVAVSDTYYSGADLEHILTTVIGRNPFAAVYSSADLGLTKHAGGLFAEVARREGREPARILHVGDNVTADVSRARAAGWHALHLPRERLHRARKLAGKVLAAPAVAGRGR